MTDQILAGLLVVALAACVTYAALLRLREVKRQRKRPIASCGVNRFKEQSRSTDLASFN